VISWLGRGSLATLLLGILALLGVVLARAQDALKVQLTFLATQPILSLVILTIAIAALMGFIGWWLESIRKKP